MPTTLTETRNEFWRAVAAHDPRIAGSLADDVFPVWAIAGPVARTRGPFVVYPPRAVVDLAAVLDSADRLAMRDVWSPEVKERFLDRAVDEWGRRNGVTEHLDIHLAVACWARAWGLARDWCVEAAAWTLDRWARDPEALAAREWGPESQYAETVVGVDLVFTTDPWRHEVDTWGDFAERAEREFKAALKAHRAQMLADREARGRQGVRVAPSAVSIEKHHLEWLVQFQWREATYSAIARAGNIASHKSVSEAIRRAADVLGLDLRPVKKGHAAKGMRPAQMGVNQPPRLAPITEVKTMR